MKKLLLLALAVALAALAAVSPWLFGLKTEQVFRSRLAESSVKGQMRFDITKYERGYLDSDVEVLITLDFLGEVANSDPEAMKLTRLLFQGKVHHGPFTYGAGSFEGESAPLIALGAMDGSLRFEQEPVFYQMFFGQSPLVNSRAVIGPTGTANLLVKGVQLTYKAPDATFEIDWKGFTARMKITGDKVVGTVDGPGLAASSQIGAFTLDSYKSAFDLTKHQTGYYLGRQEMSMNGVKVSVAGQDMFNSGKLTAAYDSKAAEALMSFTSDVELERFEVGGKPFGPMKLKTLGGNIDLNALKLLEQAYRDLLANAEAGKKANPEGGLPPGSDPSAGRGAPNEGQPAFKLGDDIINALKMIVAGGPSIEVPLFFLDTPEGKIDGRVKMGVNPKSKIDFEKPESVETALYMDFNLTVPRKLAADFLKLSLMEDARRRMMLSDPYRYPTDEEVADMAGRIAERNLEQKIRQGFYVPKGENLYLAGGLKDGTLTVNGKRIPL